MITNQELVNLTDILLKAKRIVVLTGAGVSAESGIPTFRGEEGLWKQYRAEQLATPGAFEHDPKLVWEWYDWRRGIIASKNPNPGHFVLARWEKIFPAFAIITQNIDGFHRRAGSQKILELHGNIWKVRCTQERTVTENQEVPLPEIPPICPECGALLRPHVVWFGESLDFSVIDEAFKSAEDCDVMLVIGTSAVVHPAASLPISAAQNGAKIVEINPDPTPLTPSSHFTFRGKSGDILPEINAALEKAKQESGG